MNEIQAIDGFQKVDQKELEEIMITCMIYRMNLLVSGPPGCGKSKIQRQAVDKLAKWILEGKIELPKTIKLGNREIPYVSNPNAKIYTRVIHGVTQEPTNNNGVMWVAVQADGKPKAFYIPLEEMELMTTTTDMVNIHLEDFGQLTDMVQAGWMQITEEREINGFKISPSVSFTITTNRRSDQVAVRGVLGTIKDRFLMTELWPRWEPWHGWGLRTGRIVPTVLAYHKMVGINDPDVDHLNHYVPTSEMVNSPTSRGWERLSNIEEMPFPEKMKRKLYVGCVGKEEAGAYHKFKENIGDFVSPDSIINNPEKADIPKKMDVMWAVLTAVASRSNIRNFPNIVKYSDRLSKEWKQYLISDCIRKNPELENSEGNVSRLIEQANRIVGQ